MIAQSYKSATKAIIVYPAVCHIFSAATYKKKIKNEKQHSATIAVKVGVECVHLITGGPKWGNAFFRFRKSVSIEMFAMYANC